MKKILFISYLSKENEGRIKRHYEHFENNGAFEIELIQGCVTSEDKSSEKNVINIMLNKSSNIGRFFEFFCAVKKILKEKKYDYIFLNNYFTAIFSFFVAGDKTIYDAYELYYPGCGKKMSLRDYFFYLCEKKVIKKSKYVISTNEERAFVMVGVYKLDKIPIIVKNVPVEFDRTLVESSRKHAIVYAGYLSEERGIIDLIDAVKVYNSRYNKKIALDIFGYGELETQIKVLCDENSEINYLGKYKNDNINSILKNYEIGYIGYSNEEINTVLCSPNKLYDYIVNENVIIGNDNYSLVKFINKFKIGEAGNDMLDNIEKVVNNFEKYFNQVRNVKRTLDFSHEYDKITELVGKG